MLLTSIPALKLPPVPVNGMHEPLSFDLLKRTVSGGLFRPYQIPLDFFPYLCALTTAHCSLPQNSEIVQDLTRNRFELPQYVSVDRTLPTSPAQLNGDGA
jgi:hypothetical protein